MAPPSVASRRMSRELKTRGSCAATFGISTPHFSASIMSSVLAQAPPSVREADVDAQLEHPSDGAMPLPR